MGQIKYAKWYAECCAQREVHQPSSRRDRGCRPGHHAGAAAIDEPYCLWISQEPSNANSHHDPNRIDCNQDQDHGSGEFRPAKQRKMLKVYNRGQESHIEDHDLWIAEGDGKSSCGDACHIFQVRNRRYATPNHLMTRNARANDSAIVFRPQTAIDSQIASPIHIATRNGKTSRWPLARTRATKVAMLGPGEPAAIVSAPAKMNNENRSIWDSGSKGTRLDPCLPWLHVSTQ